MFFDIYMPVKESEKKELFDKSSLKIEIMYLIYYKYVHLIEHTAVSQAHCVAASVNGTGKFVPE